jgi:hypothetical protein
LSISFSFHGSKKFILLEQQTILLVETLAAPLPLLSVIFQLHINSVSQQVTRVISFAQDVTAIINLQSVEQTVINGPFKIVLSCAKEQPSGRLPQIKNLKISSFLRMAFVGLNSGAFHTGTQLACLLLT